MIDYHRWKFSSVHWWSIYLYSKHHADIADNFKDDVNRCRLYKTTSILLYPLSTKLWGYASFNMTVCLSVCLSVRPSVYLSVCLSVRPSFFLSVSRPHSLSVCLFKSGFCTIAPFPVDWWYFEHVLTIIREDLNWCWIKVEKGRGQNLTEFFSVSATSLHFFWHTIIILHKYVDHYPGRTSFCVACEA